MIQGDCNGLEHCASRNLMKFNQGKGRLLHLGGSDPSCQDRLGADGLGSSSAEKGLKVLVDKKLNMGQKCAFTTMKPNCISVNVSKSTASRMREIIIPLCFTLMRLHLKGCVQF